MTEETVLRFGTKRAQPPFPPVQFKKLDMPTAAAYNPACVLAIDYEPELGQSKLLRPRLADTI
jgi:hypothetical protein